MTVRPEPGPVRAAWRRVSTSQSPDALAEVDTHHGALMRIMDAGATAIAWLVARVLDGLDLAAWSVEVVLSTAAAPFLWAWERLRAPQDPTPARSRRDTLPPGAR